MLGKNGNRELVYVSIVDEIKPIPGYDRVEYARVNGWWCIVQKNQFKVGDPAIYFEVDSKVPSDRECFAFLAKRKYKIKTIKMCGVISQGLLMHAEDFGWSNELDADGHPFIWERTDHYAQHWPDNESRFLTKKLGVTHIEDEDNKPAQNVDKYKAMAQRRPNIFKQKWACWMMRREWGRKLMFALFGRKKKKSETAFPTKFPYVHKSDEERIENMPFLLKDKQPWIKTQKIDGTSSTYILARGRFGKLEKYVCSRNVRQLTPSQKTYHKDIEENVYWMMAEKYHIFDFLEKYLYENKLDYVCLQGETAGPSLQGNPHKFKEICFFGYNFIRSDSGRMNSIEAAQICQSAGIPWVPIADSNYILPDDMETLKLDADGPCIVGEGMREGWVCRSYDGKLSFKNVSREYLLKHD
jgi:hypothetical protein